MPTNLPSNPAPVSGPGALSQRTDGGPSDRQPMRTLPNAGYGEAQQFTELQAGAPMYAEPQAPPMPPPPSLFDPTHRPDEPVTSGIASGPGEGPAPSLSEGDSDMKLIRSYLPAFRRAAMASNAPKTFKSFVRLLEASTNG